MPRDKTNTHKLLLASMKAEFLRAGFEKASLKTIAEQAGITPAGIYRHFSSKEAMFDALVAPVTSEFTTKFEASMDETYDKLSDKDFLEHFNTFRAAKNKEFMNYVYDHFDIFRLLLVCSKGTSYEHFEEQLVENEVQSIQALFAILDARGLPHHTVTDSELHILCTTFIAAACEAIKHNYTRAQAMEHMDFIGKMFYPGIKSVLGF